MSESVNMEELVALCKRRGFIYPASEIYGGINGFWASGPLGVQLKNNLRDRWWRDMVECPPLGPDGNPLQIVGMDSAIIQNPKTWEASGHVAGFNDPMVDDRETKQRFRADHLFGLYLQPDDGSDFEQQLHDFRIHIADDPTAAPKATVVASTGGEAEECFTSNAKRIFRDAKLKLNLKDQPEAFANFRIADKDGNVFLCEIKQVSYKQLQTEASRIPSPFTQKTETLTEPRQFNLMFDSHAGAVKNDASKVYLRPETAQGIFLNYANVRDTMRVKLPFGVAQVGKAFRNEVTPRNFIFRSREFEQMEMEWFCHPDEAETWYEFWKEQRMNWWRSLGISTDNLCLRDHESDELAHYSKMCVDIEYRYPFTAPDFGELEGISHRGSFDLTQHQEHSHAKMQTFDTVREERYIPNVIEPASGLTRGVLVLLCEAFTPTPDRKGSKYILSFPPSLAPIQAAIFPLVAKEGMPETARKLYLKLRNRFTCAFDVKQSIGKRYARMDEVGTPYCFTIDGQTAEDQTVTVRERDTASQSRIPLDGIEKYLDERIGA